MPHAVSIEFDEALPEAERDGLDTAALGALAERALASEAAEDGAVTVLLAGDDRLRELNAAHRDVDEPTDVLSFPAAEAEAFPGEVASGEAVPSGAEAARDEGPRYLGDIAISVPAARRQAAEAHLDLADELGHLMVHGLLHLLGYDHETPEDDAELRAIEEALLGDQIHAGRAHED